MKIRSDYVTNSSSSSFILAQKGELNEAQKEAILRYVTERMMGDTILTPESSEEEIQKVFKHHYIYDEDQDAIRQALADGKTVFQGDIDFECCDYAYAAVFKSLWQTIQEANPDTFSVLDGDLNY